VEGEEGQELLGLPVGRGADRAGDAVMARADVGPLPLQVEAERLAGAGVPGRGAEPLADLGRERIPLRKARLHPGRERRGIDAGRGRRRGGAQGVGDVHDLAAEVHGHDAVGEPLDEPFQQQTELLAPVEQGAQQRHLLRGCPAGAPTPSVPSDRDGSSGRPGLCALHPDRVHGSATRPDSLLPHDISSRRSFAKGAQNDCGQRRSTSSYRSPACGCSPRRNRQLPIW